MMLLPIFTEDILHKGASGMGILVSISAIGAMACSLVLASLPNRSRGMMLIISSLILGAALTVFAFSSSWTLSIIAIIFVGLGQTGRMTLAGTLLQHYVEDAYRGRVMAIYMMEFGLTSLGVFLAGVLSDSIGVQWAVGGLAILLVAMTAAVAVFSPKLRALQ
jgi:MFS family permease